MGSRIRLRLALIDGLDGSPPLGNHYCWLFLRPEVTGGVCSRTTPRLSINQLASYLTATPAQRRTVLRDAKRPPTFKVNWYEPARQAITAFIACGLQQERTLLTEMERLENLTPDNDYEEIRWRTNIAAIESVIGSYDQLDFGGIPFSSVANEQPRLSINGVEISVRPEFACRGSVRGRDITGGLKLYFSKEDPLTDQTAPFITCIVMKHVQSHHTPNGCEPRHACCLAYDIFAGRAYAAPTAITRRVQDIEAGCQEISLLWPTV